MLDPIEEARFDELKIMCRELHVPTPPEIHIGFQVHDKDGALIFDDKQRGHSWTRNFWNYLFSTVSDAAGSNSSTFAAGYLSGKTEGGTINKTNTRCCSRSLASDTILGYGLHDNVANATYGIIVGTGTTAFSAEHNVLATKIAHGNASTQLAYNAMGAPVQAYTAGTKTWKNTIARIFNNNSGGLITVAETGLLGNYSMYGSGETPYLVERSVLDPTVPVANGAQLTVTYEISMDFSAID